MDEEKLAAAFNEWMRLYTEEPQRFAREWETVVEYLGDKAAGNTPSYGQTCAKFLLSLLK